MLNRNPTAPLNSQLLQSGKPIPKLAGNWNTQEQIQELKQFNSALWKEEQVMFLSMYQTQGDGYSPERERKATLMFSLVTLFIQLVAGCENQGLLPMEMGSEIWQNFA